MSDDRQGSLEEETVTALHRNPFFFLGITPRDNRRRIIEAAEDKSLSLDEALCKKAQSDLTNLRTRLFSEVAWLPGLSPQQALDLMRRMELAPKQMVELEGIPPLAHVNLVSAALTLFGSEAGEEKWTSAILCLASLIEQIDAGYVMRELNEDRAIAGFPEVRGSELFEEALFLHHEGIRENLKHALDSLPTDMLLTVVTAVVEIATRGGEAHAPILIDELVDIYEVEATYFLECEADNIRIVTSLAENAIEHGENAVSAQLDKLEILLRNWHRVAQPIQLSTLSRGLDHKISYNLAGGIRSLGISLFNEHDMEEAALRITTLLQEVFREVPKVSEHIEADARNIEAFFVQRGKSRKNEQDRVQEISFRKEIGYLFKTTLTISPGGVQWGDVNIALDDVTVIRWSATNQYANAISIGAKYSIYIGDGSREISIVPRQHSEFEDITVCLWKAVGARLLVDMLRNLRRGKKYNFSEAVITDEGVELVRSKFSSVKDRVHCAWRDISFWSTDGYFFIGKKDNKDIHVELSRLWVDNVPVLEAGVGMLLQRGGTKLSSLIE